MASIEERKTSAGTSFVIVFRNDGKRNKVYLDAGYNRRDAENARLAVQGFLEAKRKGEPLDRRTRNYFETAPPDLLKRFGCLGFEIARTQRDIGSIWNEFRAFEETTVKDSTITHREIVFKRFAAFFSPNVRFEDLTPVRVQEFRDELVKHYAPTTVAKSIVDLRTFGEWAIKRGYATSNPFKEVPTGKTGNRSRDFQVPVEWTERILEACPSQCWRTLYCLWRLAGLRQQEPMLLTRESVDLDERKLTVYATKTERYEKGGYRTVPITQLLARELETQLDILPNSEPFLIFENRRKAFDSGFRRILFDAGLEKWPKTFQNLRSSCENDWIKQGIPSHVVADWLGHSVKTQEAYYLRVLPEYFDRVTAPNGEMSHAAENVLSRGTKRGTI